MTMNKKPARSAEAESKGDGSSEASDDETRILRTNDIVAVHARASEAFVAGMIHNRMKELEHGHDNTVAPALIKAIAAHRHPSRDSNPAIK